LNMLTLVLLVGSKAPKAVEAESKRVAKVQETETIVECV
jgi:hypothetical protein